MILVFGSTGQLGQALQAVLADRDATFLSRTEADLSQPEQIKALLHSFPVPEAVINAAAYTAVDKAEEEEAVAHAVNAESPRILAEYCAHHAIPLLHFSTDYVFDGSGDDPRAEDISTAPLNAYGRSKQVGENAVTERGGDYLIFRTSWVYDAEAKNFLNTILRLGAEREALKVVNDQIGAPSYAPHLAQASVNALDKAMAMASFPSGIYHMCNAGETSWCGFAQEIFEQARAHGVVLKVKEVTGIPTTDYPLPAPRPLNSRLSCDKLQQTFCITMPSWQEGVAECMEGKYGHS